MYFVPDIDLCAVPDVDLVGGAIDDIPQNEFREVRELVASHAIIAAPDINGVAVAITLEPVRRGIRPSNNHTARTDKHCWLQPSTARIFSVRWTLLLRNRQREEGLTRTIGLQRIKMKAINPAGLKNVVVLHNRSPDYNCCLSAYVWFGKRKGSNRFRFGLMWTLERGLS